MHNVEQIYDEDMDLSVEMSEHLVPFPADQRNDGNIFFLMNQLFTFAGS